MKTIVQIKIDTNTERIEFGYWDPDEEDFVPATDTEEGQAKVAEYLGCTPELVDALQMAFADVAERIATDLSEIWERLDKLEKMTWGHG